jgi:hypothetical protein
MQDAAPSLCRHACSSGVHPALLHPPLCSSAHLLICMHALPACDGPSHTSVHQALPLTHPFSGAACSILPLLPCPAVEYDYLPAHQCHATLETKRVQGLFFSGQLNGTTGGCAPCGSACGIVWGAACMPAAGPALLLAKPPVGATQPCLHPHPASSAPLRLQATRRRPPRGWWRG